MGPKDAKFIKLKPENEILRQDYIDLLENGEIPYLVKKGKKSLYIPATESNINRLFGENAPFKNEKVKTKKISQEEMNDFIKFDFHQKVDNLRVSTQGIEDVDDFDARVLAKIDAGKDLTRKEYEELLFDGYEIDRITGEKRRWTTCVESIIQIQDRTFSIEWEEGLTENQENYYGSKPVEVVSREETKIIRVWEPVQKDKEEDCERE